MTFEFVFAGTLAATNLTDVFVLCAPEEYCTTGGYIQVGSAELGEGCLNIGTQSCGIGSGRVAERRTL